MNTNNEQTMNPKPVRQQAAHAKLAISVAALAFALFTGVAQADKLDDIMAKGTLRCGVVLDFPPMGYRNEKNEPAGFDVDYCHDLGKALGTAVTIESMSFAQRLPALNAGKVDVVIASTSDTLERAKSAGFTIPYFVFKVQVLVHKDANINSFDELKGKKVTGSLSTVNETEFQKNAKLRGWSESDYFSSKSESDTHLAVLQGKADALVTSDTAIAELLKLPKFADFKAGPFVPDYSDYVSIITKRSEYGLINYLNLFIHQQVRTGRYAELYQKYFGDGSIPKLTIDNVYY